MLENVNELPRHFNGTNYCAITGDFIEGDFFKIKRKHIINRSSKTQYDGMFKTRKYRVTTTSYLWDIYSVSPEAYKKHKRKSRLFCGFIPLLIFIASFYFFYCLLNGINGLGDFLLVSFLSLIPTGLIGRMNEYIIKPKLLKEGLIYSMAPENDEVFAMDEF